MTETAPYTDTAAAPAPHSAVGPPRLVAIGGGTGLPVVLQGLAERLAESASPVSRQHLTAIVTVTDDGGSSGWLRREFGILPPGDIRNCLTALAEDPHTMSELLQHRFTGGTALQDQAVGNLILLALTQMTGDFTQAVERLSELLAVRGRVFPSTGESVTLRARFGNGEVVEGETAIVARHDRITELSLAHDVRPLPETIEALVNADAIVVGPGSLYTSVLPNLLISGIAPTIAGVNAVRIYVANLMTQPGETDGYSVDDHLAAIHAHVGLEFDYVLVNRRPVTPRLIELYGDQGSVPVRPATTDTTIRGARVIEQDLATDVVGGKIRHAPGDLARVIWKLIEAGRPTDPLRT